ncbi:hypothetical protein Cgig2_003403 [Carnegiea gigantea]|uniref:RNase H type-1 domain-containing protein n=1 Tax=Carnegiea gigantea TaxID=171969 RepID=A0A9Q1K973_9CARY|nr:hypothetical protein Cgig2_003403 [Carnegiea gigantea]
MGQWREEKVRDLFGQDDAEAVLRIHLSFRDRAGPSESRGFEWLNIWGLKINPQVQHFAWKVQGSCAVCPYPLETALHVLRDCPAAQEVWGLYNKGDEVRELDAFNGAEWFGYFVEEWNETDAAHFVTICWAIWNNHNLKVFNDSSRLPSQTIQWVMSLCERYLEAGQWDGTRQHASLAPLPVGRWRPLVVDTYKLNTDAALLTDRGIGLGIIIRDHMGDIMVQSHFSVEMAEALAICSGMEIAKDSGFRSIEVESDSLSIIIKIRTSDIPHNEVGLLIEDIVNMSKDFSHCSFHFVKRDGDRVAHVLAKLDPYKVVDQIWMEEGPSEIYDVLTTRRRSI